MTEQLDLSVTFFSYYNTELLRKIILCNFFISFVAENFWYICLLGTSIAGLCYGRFIVISHKFKLLMYMQESLVLDGRGYLHTDVNEKTVSSR
jgi:hypothetical protein